VSQLLYKVKGAWCGDFVSMLLCLTHSNLQLLPIDFKFIPESIENTYTNRASKIY